MMRSCLRGVRACSFQRLSQSSCGFLYSSRRYCSVVEGSESDFEVEGVENVVETASEPQNTAEQSVQVNLLRLERSLELQEDGRSLLQEDKFDLAESAFFSAIATIRSYLNFKHSDASESKEMKVESAEMLEEPLAGLAYSQLCLGKIDEALRSFDELFAMLKVLPENTEAKARYTMNYAELLSNKGRYQDAIDATLGSMKSLEKSELYASGLVNVSVYYSVLKQHEKAISYAKDGFELLSNVLGKNNQFTERALGGYMRILTDAGKGEEAEKVLEQWESTRRQQELTVDAEDIHISESLANSLKHFAAKKTFDPHGIIVPPEVLRTQHEKFCEEYKKSNFVDLELVDSISSEFGELEDIIAKSKLFHKESNRLQEEAKQFAIDNESDTITAPVFTGAYDEFYSDKEEYEAAKQ